MTNERPEEHEAMVIPSEIRPWFDLKSTGLLWLINASVMHPRGFALGLARDPASGEIVGWRLLGDGAEPWVFEGAANGACDQNFADVDALFANARRPTNTSALATGGIVTSTGPMLVGE